MQIYKLKYQDKETALADLIAKGVYIETDNELIYGQGIHAVVEIGLIVQTEPTFDEEGNVLTEPIYFNGYHYDVMTSADIAFANAIEPNNPIHTFL